MTWRRDGRAIHLDSPARNDARLRRAVSAWIARGLLAAAAVLSGLLALASPAPAYGVPAPTGGSKSPPAISATTRPVSVIGPTSAVLEGEIATNGNAVRWQFEFGPSAAYGSTTPMQTAGPGGGQVPVSWQLTGLTPFTVYHFRLVATTQPTAGEPSASSTGQDMTFTTGGSGLIRLLFSRLKVKRTSVALPLKCDSELTCAGRLSITTSGRQPGKRPRSLLCGTRSFALKGGEARRVRMRLTRRCLSLIAHRHPHRIQAQVTATPSTSQYAFIRTATLTLGGR